MATELVPTKVSAKAAKVYPPVSSAPTPITDKQKLWLIRQLLDQLGN